MKASKLILFLASLVVLLAGCTFEVIQQSVDTPLYKGQSLNLVVIGDPPIVRERHVTFTEITFEDLKKGAELASHYDAVFIMKEHLREAAEGQYAKRYGETRLPIFFVESKQPAAFFTLEDVEYDTFADIYDGMYIKGFLLHPEGQPGGDPPVMARQDWGFGLYNDIVNDTNVKDVYSRVFETIASNKNDKKQKSDLTGNPR
ncbi:hypothetical protein [Bacillus sp. FJAT-27264]|uniref:hypothetical protein n=1 Tax=Paenibacillus sp. (strain DSM 101736 / FJAT-27264) TaxID=1850362 RepID=UPI00111252FC|nr:hypothetical protein [Bacillus sp. FJAT-27264]